MTANELKRLRAVTGLTQDGLARLLGVSLSAVQKWEHGSNIPGPMAELIRLKVGGER